MNLLRGSGTVLQTCPVCTGTVAKQRKHPAFETPGQRLKPHVKYECETCGHVYTTWLPHDIDDVAALYERCYPVDGSPTPRLDAEKELVERVVRQRGGVDAVLDFGCGDNHPVIDQLEAVYACDVRPGYPYSGRLFRFDPDEPPPRTFDAIVSVDAIEHVQHIKRAWQWFNLSLPVGGLMAHSFPLADHHRPDHHFRRIPFHGCLFSERSLVLWADRMGFRFLGAAPLSSSDVGTVYWFEKLATPP